MSAPRALRGASSQSDSPSAGPWRPRTSPATDLPHGPAPRSGNGGAARGDRGGRPARLARSRSTCAARATAGLLLTLAALLALPAALHAQEAEYPPNPTDLTVVPAGNGKVTLSWTTPGDGGSPITKHQYRRQYEGTNIWVDIPNSAAGGTNANSYTVSGLTNGTRYYFYVRAWSAIGSSGLSNFAWGNAGSVPPAPTNFMVEPGDAQVSFTWTTPGDGGNPIIYHMLRHNVDGAGYGGWALIPDSAPGETNANSYTKLNVLNLTFASQVLAVNSTGRGEPSSEVTVTVVSTDATLSNLSLSDGTLTPAFASGTTSYTASVGNAVSQITVTPTKSDRDASVEYLDASDATITDADGTATGQQVDLDVGANTIKVKVTATDAMTTETYTVTVTRAPPPGPPTVSIAADTQGVREGEAAAFTLSRTGSAAAALMVSVSVTQEGDFISGAKPTSVTFGAGDAAVALEIATVNDEVGEDNGSITVTVTSVPSGTEISQTAASATLVVADKDDTWATVSVDQAAVTVKESAGTVTLGFSARMEPNVTPFSMKVSASTLLGTARFDEDYVSITDEVTFAAADFQMESGRLVAHKTLDVTILNNHAGRWEGDETFTFKVERSPTLPGSVIFVDQDGDKVSNVTTTITITDDEAPPSLDLSVAPSFVEEGDTATVKVTSANGSAFAEDQTINLSFSGIAARGADYTVGDDVLTLGAGLTEVTTTVMVLDDSIDDDAGETIVIEAAHAGTSFSQTYTLVIGGLAPPTMLPVTPGDGRVKVCFDAVGATGYTVQWRSASQQFSIRRQKTVFETSETRDCGPGTVSTAIRDLDNGTTYWFRAQSTREWWDDKKGRQSEVSDWSDAVSGTPTAGPAPPANVVLTPGNQQLKVDWDPVAGADGYSVEWRQDGYFRALDTTTNSATITGLQNGRSYGVRVLAENVSGRSAWSAVVRGAPGQPTASFRNVPAAHDGQNAIRFQVGFSHEMGSGEQSLRDDSFTVNDGDVTGTRRVDESNKLWEVTVQPDSREEMTILLPGRDCGETGAVCTDEDTPRPLTNSPLATVEGPSTEPLTASFEELAPEHDGETVFTFRVRFSEPVPVGYRVLREAFSVSGGTVKRARRVGGANNLREIHVQPETTGEIRIALPSTTDCDAAGAICTSDNRPLSNSMSATVAAPVGISVADARVEEDEGALLAFAVTLSRAASSLLTVDYGTADVSAHAGEDYTATSGTLSFQAGESSKTIEVKVLDDAHDEGEETLTLTLLNASAGRLTDGEATGTIKNRDPLPRALLARFGRTAAVHVVEHVEERLQAPREPGFRGRFAGRELRRGMEREMALSLLNRLGGSAGAHPLGGGARGPLGGSSAGGMGSLGTPGLAAGTPMAAAGGPMGAVSGLGAAAGPLGAAGPDGGLNGGGLLQMGLGAGIC